MLDVVPPCCHLTRRQLLQWSAVVAATPILSAIGDPERAYGLTWAQVSNPTVAINLELVTLTETTAILTWFTGDPTRVDNVGRLAPMPANTEVLLGTSPASLQQVHFDAKASPYHYVELTGLEPGQTYFYVAQSGGIPAIPAASSFGGQIGTSSIGLPSGPFIFTTPQPPPGSYLFSLALCNDLHLGETVAGLATTQAGIQIPPGISQVDGQPPYPEVMAAALAREARERGAHRLLVGGDVSGEAARTDVRAARSFLDAFGTLGQDYYVVRGNHDRPHTGPKSDGCRAVPGAAGYHDCFADSFFPTGETWFAKEAFGLRFVGLDTYDTIGNGSGNGVMSAPQFAFVRDELARSKDQPTIVFGHHPVTVESNLTSTPPVVFDLDPQQAMQLEALYAGAPGVFLHHAGHTHRNKRTVSPNAPGVVFQEVAAAKEYPGGFNLVRVFTGGYATNFYKYRDQLAQEWTERSRPEYGGAQPFYTFGNTMDRNSVVARDLSGLKAAAAAAAAPAAPTPKPRPTAARPLPATGDTTGVALAGTVAAAAASATAWLPRQARAPRE